MRQPGGVSAVAVRNFERLVTLAMSPTSSSRVTREIADALAASVSEVTPVHREVLSAKITQLVAAPGRINMWRIPPTVQGNEQACRKWAALVLLDCVDAIVDRMSAEYPFDERIEWRRRACLLTQGAEASPVDIRG